MRPQSAKSKGRRLQQFIAKELLNIARILDPTTEINEDDIRSTPMGCSGIDVQLSTAARKIVNFDVETKNQERPSFWKCIEQTEAASVKGVPLLIMKKNNTKAWACVPWDDFKKLVWGIDEFE